MIETMMIDGPSARKHILKCLLGIVPTWADLNCHLFSAEIGQNQMMSAPEKKNLGPDQRDK